MVLLLFLGLRVGLELGVAGSFGTLWSVFLAPPLVASGPPAASPDIAKSNTGTGLPEAGGASPGVVASPTA